ncbi:uncharacterized protein [Anabrus simplex]|uniref:uncharacterized protein n=1 Tax=Anabrus simplex TaxID=316456 RepID=UPI0035A293DF
MAKFNCRERELLAEICKNYPILADMGYHLDTVTKKKEAWVKIQAEFNSMNAGKPPKDVPQLKGLWKRMKIKAKGDIDAQRRDARQTGGGPPKPPLGKPEQILSEMFGGQFDPLPDTIDDDAGAFQEGPGEEESLGAEERMPQETPSFETPTRSSKRKCNDQMLQTELLEMARLEHQKKMKILEIKQRTQEMKQRNQELKCLLLEHQLKINNILP